MASAPSEDRDLAFLKEDVGPILAKGLAQTVAASPHDPVEYLALWLVHYLQQRELELKKRETLAAEEKEREQWSRVRMGAQAQAAQVIQREWKHCVSVEQARQREEKALLELIHDKERALEEVDELREENIVVEEFEGITEQERAKSLDKGRAAAQFTKSQRLLECLTKSSIATVKFTKKPHPSVVAVIKGYFYLFGATVKQLSSWAKISMMIKPVAFLEKAVTYQPLGEGVSRKKRPITRIRRLLKGVEEEKLRSQSIAVFLLCQWLKQVVELRTQHAEERAMKKELGRDVEDEEEEEEEDPENEEKDPDEEKQRLIELEEERLRKEQEEREGKERGEDEDGEEAGDS